MKIPKIIIDTNILISALKSKQGASYKLLTLIGKGKFETSVSVPLVFEYEDAAKKIIKNTQLTLKNVDDIIDYICAMSSHTEIYYLWRPYLSDPKDDMILELAVSSSSGIIVTYNRKDFKGSEKLGIKVLTPGEFLKIIGEIT